LPVTLGILNHFAASEDAAQEAFLAAWRKLHELREPERLRSWLGQIARNTALGHLRRLRGHDTLTPVPSLADEAPGPDEAVATEEEATLVRDALAKLPENYRQPLRQWWGETPSSPSSPHCTRNGSTESRPTGGSAGMRPSLRHGCLYC
jgi:RNA polymerase sigma factor (sigma-70 family)